MDAIVADLGQQVVDKLQQMRFAIEEGGVLRAPDGDKDGIRQLHGPARQMELAARQDWLRRNLPRYLPFFANGHEVIPERIRPTLVEVTTVSQHDLFRTASLY